MKRIPSSISPLRFFCSGEGNFYIKLTHIWQKKCVQVKLYLVSNICTIVSRVVAVYGVFKVVDLVVVKSIVEQYPKSLKKGK